MKTVALRVFENPKENRTEGYDKIVKQAQIALTTPRNTDLVTFRKRYSSIPFFVV